MYMAFETKFSQILNGNFHIKQNKKIKTPNVCLLQYNFTVSLGKFTFIIMGEGLVRTCQSKLLCHAKEISLWIGLSITAVHVVTTYYGNTLASNHCSTYLLFAYKIKTDMVGWISQSKVCPYWKLSDLEEVIHDKTKSKNQHL